MNQLSAASPTEPYLGLEGAQVSDGGVTMSYRYFMPPRLAEGEKVPLILYLHSNGRQGSNNTSQLDFRVTRYVEAAWQARQKAVVLAPQVPDGRWVDTNWEHGSYNFDAITITPAMRMTIDLIEQFIANHPVDTDRVYALGTSMGGFGVWNIMMHRPDLFAAAVPVQGGADLSKASRLAHIPVWSWHGDADSTIPVSASREIMAKMDTAAKSSGYGSGHLKYTELAGFGHGGVAEEAFTPTTDAWFLSCKRGCVANPG